MTDTDAMPADSPQWPTLNSSPVCSTMTTSTRDFASASTALSISSGLLMSASDSP
jgi:hypothetical protein